MYPEVSPESSPLAKVYRLSPARYRTLVLMYAFGATLCGVFFLMLFDPQLPWSMASGDFKVYAVIIWGGVAGVLALLFIDRIRLRLVTSPDGIVYIGLGYRIFTPWNNVTGMGVRTVGTEMRGAKRDVTGLLLRHPAPVVKVKVWARFLLGWRDASPTFIPISDFAGYQSELSEVIRQYASGVSTW